jgi:hypothetical protein
MQYTMTYSPTAKLRAPGPSSGSRTATLLHFLGKLSYGLLSDHASFTASKRSTGVVERSQKLRALTFAFLP